MCLYTCIHRHFAEHGVQQQNTMEKSGARAAQSMGEVHTRQGDGTGAGDRASADANVGMRSSSLKDRLEAGADSIKMNNNNSASPSILSAASHLAEHANIRRGDTNNERANVRREDQSTSASMRGRSEDAKERDGKRTSKHREEDAMYVDSGDIQLELLQGPYNKLEPQVLPFVRASGYAYAFVGVHKGHH